MQLLPIFQAIESSGFGRTIRESVWAFAVIESIHLLALALIGGSVLLVDMRMLRLGLRNRSVAELARETQPWLRLSLAIMLVSGVSLFASEAVKCYYSTPFWVKMWSLLFAVLFTFTVRRRVTLAEDGRFSSGIQMLTAIVSLALWFGVGAGGRWIGFSG